MKTPSKPPTRKPVASGLGPEFSIVDYGNGVHVSVRNCPWPDAYRDPSLLTVQREFWDKQMLPFIGEVV